MSFGKIMRPLASSLGRRVIDSFLSGIVIVYVAAAFGSGRHKHLKRTHRTVFFALIWAIAMLRRAVRKDFNGFIILLVRPVQ